MPPNMGTHRWTGAGGMLGKPKNLENATLLQSGDLGEGHELMRTLDEVLEVHVQGVCLLRLHRTDHGVATTRAPSQSCGIAPKRILAPFTGLLGIAVGAFCTHSDPQEPSQQLHYIYKET